MGVAIPQVITEDRAGGAQIVDGGLRFDSSKTQYLTRTPGSVGNRQTWTWSGWVKRNSFGVNNNIFSGIQDGNNGTVFYFDTSNCLSFFNYISGAYAGRRITTNVYRDSSSWYHILLVWDSTNATISNRIRIYVNGIEVTTFSTSTDPSSSSSIINSTNSNQIGADVGFNNGYSSLQLSNAYFIDGQALDPSYFGYTDPLTNVWRPKKLSSSVAFGTNGFYLPFDGSAPIGQDQSGRGNNWTPVNFGGSNTIEKATGALPILNTDGGGKVARVGVRTDANASSLVLALPLVGIKSDFSNAINSGTSNKTVTINGDAAASSAQSNFYGGSFVFDGTGDYLSLNASADFGFSTPSGNANDFTIEWFKYWNSLSGYQTIWSNNYTSSPGILIQTGNGDGKYRVFVSAGTELFQETNAAVVGVWYHYALVRNGTTYTIYRNGVANGSATSSNAAGSGSDVATIGQGNGSYYENGYIQDFRIYKGLAKYTSNFIPASTDPDIVPDSPSGVSYSSNLTQITDGAVAFDGSGDYLDVPDDGSFDFGTGDFTIECFINFSNYTTSRTDITGTSNNSVYLGASKSGWILSTLNNNIYFSYQSNSSWIFETPFSVSLTSGKWYHIAVSRSGTNLRCFVDGVQVGSTSTNSTDLQSTENVCRISGGYGSTNSLFTGFISNLHIVKGTALYTSNFTPPTGPISSVANTKLLCCKSNSSATAADVTPGTITANGDAKASNFNPFTANINTQRGKQSGYATLNPVDNPSSCTLSNGNLSFSYTATQSCTRATIGIPVGTGKYYWENYVTTVGAFTPGIADSATNRDTDYVGESAGSYGLFSSGGTAYKYNNNSGSSISGTGYAAGDTVMIAYDSNTGKFYAGCNGIWYNGSDPVAGTNPLYTVTSNTYYPAIGGGVGGICSGSINFGQKPFKFPPPAGFQPLALSNTARPTIVRPDQYVGIVTYTGNSTARSINVGFQPDFVWFKGRNNTTNHQLVDSVRGTSSYLISNSTDSEATNTTALTAFTSSGFNLGDNSNTSQRVNYAALGDTYVAWDWKAGGNSNTFNIDGNGYSTASAAGLTAGTITPTGASVGTKQGFSIVGYTGNGTSGATLSHGLGKTPAFAIIKNRDNTGSYNWVVWHQSVSQSIHSNSTFTLSGFTGALILNGTNASVTYSFDGQINGSTENHIAYLWAEIPGFSKFGSYTGNGSADGPVIITGFRPKFIMVKGSTFASNWNMYDSSRNMYNIVDNTLRANSSAAEFSSSGQGAYALIFDFLSNGFKIRYSGVDINTSNETFIYAAWAETPTFNLYGAQANAR